MSHFWGCSAVILRLLMDPRPCDPLSGHGVSSLTLFGVQMAELGFAGTVHCIFHFIFLYLFPVTNFSSFPQGWCVGITVPHWCAFIPWLVKNQKLLFAQEIFLLKVSTNYELQIANLQIKTSAPPCRCSCIMSSY